VPTLSPSRALPLPEATLDSLVKRILIIEDEPDIRELVAMNLLTAGLETLEAENGREGLELALKELPDLVILDLMMPEMDGHTVLQKIQEDEKARQIPVIMLTAKAQPGDRVTGLEMGADDYLTKPFSPRELVLRVQGLLRRGDTSASTKAAELKMDSFHLDFKRQRFHLDGENIDLTVTEFRLLALLLESAGKPLERALLLMEVWGYGDTMHTRTLDTHVKRLREKLGPAGSRIETVRGTGYVFS